MSKTSRAVSFSKPLRESFKESSPVMCLEDLTLDVSILKYLRVQSSPQRIWLSASAENGLLTSQLCVFPYLNGFSNYLLGEYCHRPKLPIDDGCP